MEPKHDSLDTLPDDWKWQALFVAPAPLATQWPVWLADAQRAEETALLTYWARRAGAGSGTS